MPGYAFHPDAELDLDDIWGYISQDSFDVADKITDRIIAAIEAAVPLPHQGHRRPDLTSRPVRFLLVYDYLIAYAPDEKPLWIIAILHGRRNPRVMAAILREREARARPSR